MKFLLVLLLFPLTLSAQIISDLTFSPSPTSIVATWTTNTASDSNITAGAHNGIDNGFQASVTSHQAIVEGLSPNTTYSVTVTSGSTTSTPQNVTTLTTPRRYMITGASNGTTTTTTAYGDTLFNFISNDNVTYHGMDDTTCWTGVWPLPASAGSNANMALCKITNESVIAGATVNLLSNYGGATQMDGTDGPGNVTMNNKQSGLFGENGQLYMFAGRCTPDGYPQAFYFGNVIMSPDHGATWNNWLAPSTFNANGSEPPVTGAGKGQFQYAQTTYGWATPIRYAADDGTYGYLTTGNRIDGADGYVYITFLDGNLYNNSHIYLMRIPRVYLQSTAHIQYWIGPISPQSSDFTSDSNWSSSDASKTAIYTNASLTSWPEIDYIPAANYYVLMTFSITNAGASNANTVWRFYAGPTPAGPWTSILTQDNSSCTLGGVNCAWYGMTMFHRDLVNNTLTQNIPIRILYTGNFTGSTSYFASYSTVTFSTASHGGVGLSNPGLRNVGLY